MRPWDWVLVAAAMIVGACCLLLAATGLAEDPIFLAPALRSTLLTWTPYIGTLCIALLGFYLLLPVERLVTMSKRLATIIAALLGAAAIAAVTLGLSAVKGAPSQDQVAAATSGAMQVSDSGGVQVQVSFEPKTGISGEEVSFRVLMDTHSVELGQFDLSKLSRVTVDPGGPLAAIAWKPKGEGGHHLEGTLTFRAQPQQVAGARTVTLEIQGVGSSETRRFQWPVR